MSELEEKNWFPSNGGEGEWFRGKYCENCIHDNMEKGKDCEMLFRSFVEDGGIDEWQYGKDGKPICTEFVKWDWDSDGDPDDPDNPKASPPPTPDNIRQTTLFPLYPDETHFEKEVKQIKTEINE